MLAEECLRQSEGSLSGVVLEELQQFDILLAAHDLPQQHIFRLLPVAHVDQIGSQSEVAQRLPLGLRILLLALFPQSGVGVPAELVEDGDELLLVGLGRKG